MTRLSGLIARARCVPAHPWRWTPEETADTDLCAMHLCGQIYLGDEDFAKRMRARIEPQARQSREVPVRQRITAARGPAT